MTKKSKEHNKKSSKKNYSFKGQRKISKSRSKSYDDDSESGDTTEQMMNILNSDNDMNHSAQMMSQPMMSQPMMGNPMMSHQMMDPMMGQQMMGQQMMGQQMMGQQMMGQQMMGQQMMGKQQMNNNMGDIDAALVETLAPVNHMGMGSDMGINVNNLMSSTQMAQSLGNLSKLNPNANMMGQSMSNQMMNSQMMPNQMMNSQMAALSPAPLQNNNQFNMGNIKNLAKLF
jgi:hypothetical protein